MRSEWLIDASVSGAALGPDRLEAAIEARVEAMANHGVAHSIVVADRLGAADAPDAARVDAGIVSRVVARHPRLLSAVIGIDPTADNAAIRTILRAREDGFVGVHLVPHAFGLPPDHPLWYPTYAACAELGIPVQVELGVRPSPGARIRSVGRPIALDVVACEFPTLRIVQLGPWPWVEEAISIAYKHPHAFLMVGGDDPGVSHPALVRFADSWGRGKVLFGSMGAPLDRAVSALAAFGLRDESADACANEVATTLFDLPDLTT